ncbi:GGDEF domain-containing protein [Stakelama sp. CBK3Z-3]|uniref:diguanylate cyclase n=1 Tax=Stakelama flava TaxID=2860338 RepID=A0ABS6XP95_9SPHN|nr:GGDEF domain-containing protein [Stakelama flava]MBW4332039.1 GGDEF domain-containing protein [Stakelama flava]
MSVSLSLVNALGLLALAVLCLGVFFSLRSQRALAWLAASLLCGGVFASVMTAYPDTPLDTFTTVLCVPGGYFCVGRAMRSLLRQSRQMHWLHAGVVALVSASLLLTFTAADRLSIICFYLGCALAASESALRLMRVRRDALDRILLAVFAGIVIPFLARVAVLIALPPGTVEGGPLIAGQSLGQMVLASEGVLTILCVFLLLGKAVGQVIAFYRLRSEQDGLTGLLNRRAFGERVSACRSEGAILLCDIDYFKQVNDRYGHPAGDAVIRALARQLRATGHAAGRMGGEEFALLLPGFDCDAATALAEHLRARFQAARIDAVSPDHRLTASFGIASFDAGNRAQAALHHADSALYAAKSAGRNQVFVHGSPAPASRHDPVRKAGMIRAA